MQLTEEDAPLMKLIFNPSTHDMGMLVGGERAKEIFEYVCNKIVCDKEDFLFATWHFLYEIIINETLCDFFWDNNILLLSFLKRFDTDDILRCSPIAEKIWESGKLDLSLLDKEDLEYFKLKFESQ